MSEAATGLEPSFLAALAAVPAAAWSQWFGDRPYTSASSPPSTRTLVATFSLPPAKGHAALCVFETTAGPDAGLLHQAALRRWTGEAPGDAQVLHRERGADGSVQWTLSAAWSDPELREWLREALSAGAALRSEGWEWMATAERPAVSRVTTGESRQITDRRHDVFLFEPGAIGIVYRRLTRAASPELDLLRHLERVPVTRMSPRVLGSAIIRAPNGQRTGSATLEDFAPEAATVRSVLVNRLRRSLEGDPSLQAAALDDVRAVGIVTRELHAALGRPFDQGVLAGAIPAAVSDVDAWVARAWAALTMAATAHRTAASGDAVLTAPLQLLPGKLQQFAAAAERAPGLIHRIHGNLKLDTVLIAPPRRLTVVEFDGEGLLSDRERLSPQSPLRDVARLLVSIAEAAAESAHEVGGDEEALEIAWLWEREARKAYLEGYGTGGGALHALLAIFELEFAAQLLADALTSGNDDVHVASHILQRLSRTIV
ncbi:MAG TPA: hypothetical protein VE861_01495 [Gemmatimonadaceae bacterium]|nr:hypothetical protein [Gemmatimonadaceae bacterium]